MPRRYDSYPRLHRLRFVIERLLWDIVRNGLVSGWMRDVDAQELPSTEGFSFTGFLAKPTDVRAWNIQVRTNRVVNGCSYGYGWCWYCSCGAFTAVSPSTNMTVPWVTAVVGGPRPQCISRVTTQRVTMHHAPEDGNIAPHRAIKKR